MEMLKFRSAALLKNKENKYLLIKEQDDKYWILPGGKKEEGESYLSTCVRELEEELAISGVDLKFLCLIENKFKLNSDNISETIVLFEGGCDSLISNQEKRIKREICWFDINALKEINIQPNCIFNIIYNKIRYIIHEEL